MLRDRRLKNTTKTAVFPPRNIKALFRFTPYGAGKMSFKENQYRKTNEKNNLEQF